MKEKKGTTPGGRSYIAEIFDDGRKRTIVGGSGKRYEKTTNLNGDVKKEEMTSRGTKSVDKGPTKKARKVNYQDPVAKNARSKMRAYDRTTKVLNSIRKK